MRFHASSILLAAACLVLGPLGCVTTQNQGAAAPSPSAPVAAAQEASFTPDAKLDGWVRGYLVNYKKEDPSQRFLGDVLLAKQGKSAVQQGYGGAFGRRFLIGSITKSMTAVAVMQLAQAGKLKLTDSIRVLIPELPEKFAPVTIELLLSHRSGMANYTADPELQEQRHKAHPRENMITALAKPALLFEPGKDFAYSNSGYFLLGVAIERASKQPWSMYMAKHIFEPAGMSDTNTSQDDLVQGWEPSEGKWLPATNVHSSFSFAAGSIVSTAVDLQKFLVALGNETLLPKAVVDQMWTNKQAPGAKGQYGYGFLTFQLPTGAFVVGHTGGIDGFSSAMFMERSGAFASIALGNTMSGEPAQVATDMLVMATTDKPVDPPKAQVHEPFNPELAKKLSGIYKISAQDLAKLKASVPAQVLDSIASGEWSGDKSYHFKPAGQPKFEIFQLKDGSFVNEAAGIHMEIQYKNDKVSGFILRQSGVQAHYEKQ